MNDACVIYWPIELTILILYYIGKRFAESKMKLALSSILSKFEVSPCEQTEVPLEFLVASSSLISPKNGVVLKCRLIIAQ